MPPNKGLMLDAPGTYKICVQGYLSESWSEYVGGSDIRVQIQPGEPPTTVVTGVFKDQAALAGALSHLCDLGFPLLSVELITVP
jgi:hypothetical protein